MSVNAAPSVLNVPASALNPGDTDESLSRLQGDATVSYPFSPDWRAAVTYHRDVQYLPGVTDPLFSDGTQAQLNGLIFDSLDLAASVGSVSSTSVYPGSNTNLDYYTARVRIGYAVTHSFALYGEYLYYYYDQSGQRSLAPGLPEVFGQHSARIGVTWSAKALGR